MKTALGKFPIDFEVAFERKQIFLPPFFTHPHGYQLCISVDPYGSNEGKETHVCVFTYIVRGPYDNQLKWPFRGEVTIQIVNQAGDHSHIEETINYDEETDVDCACRMTDKQRAFGWGELKVLAHTDLSYNAANKTQYLKDNIIVVRVVFVKLTA